MATRNDRPSGTDLIKLTNETLEYGSRSDNSISLGLFVPRLCVISAIVLNKSLCLDLHFQQVSQAPQAIITVSFFFTGCSGMAADAFNPLPVPPSQSPAGRSSCEERVTRK